MYDDDYLTQPHLHEVEDDQRISALAQAYQDANIESQVQEGEMGIFDMYVISKSSETIIKTYTDIVIPIDGCNNLKERLSFKTDLHGFLKEMEMNIEDVIIVHDKKVTFDV